MIIVRRIFFILLLLGQSINTLASSGPLTTDNRIRTYIYSPNEVFLLNIHYGFQSQIEFGKGESIKDIIAGDNFAWQLRPMGNRLFIKALEKNIQTNMTIITNRRVYQFDIVARDFDPDKPHEVMYVVKFVYPNKRK